MAVRNSSWVVCLQRCLHHAQPLRAWLDVCVPSLFRNPRCTTIQLWESSVLHAWLPAKVWAVSGVHQPSVLQVIHTYIHAVLGRDLLGVVLHLLSSPSCGREVGASRTDVAVTLVAGIGGPAAEVAGLVARPLPLGELARVLAQLGCDHDLHQHVPVRVQSVPVVGGVNVLVDTAM